MPNLDDAIRDLALTDGAVRALPAPVAVPDGWPAVATHAYHEAGRWLPAAPETLADGRYTTILPVLRLADEDAA